MLQMPGMRGREVLKCLLRAERFGMALTGYMTELALWTGALISGAAARNSSDLNSLLQPESDVSVGIVSDGVVAAAWSSSS